MIMLIPLGVLALGAMFSGMVWYKVYFGDEVKVRDWFGMEAAAHAEAHGEDHAETTTAPAEYVAIFVAPDSASRPAPAAITAALGASPCRAPGDR